VFAGIFGVTLGGDELTARILAGGACIVAAMYVVELAPRLTRGAVAPEQARPG
jgi:drug/metabolite transporter (DMT)-like permease